MHHRVFRARVPRLTALRNPKPSEANRSEAEMAEGKQPLTFLLQFKRQSKVQSRAKRTGAKRRWPKANNRSLFSSTLSGNPKSAAFSLPELLTTIAVIGILAAISIQSYRGIQDSAKETVARDNLALLNRAVLHYGEVARDITVTAVSGSATEELAILATLKTRDAEIPGSPYLERNFRDTVSSSSDDYRIQWNGHAFELLRPGTTGTGLRASD